jgi:hypothetical protein
MRTLSGRRSRRCGGFSSSRQQHWATRTTTYQQQQQQAVEAENSMSRALSSWLPLLALVVLKLRQWPRISPP